LSSSITQGSGTLNFSHGVDHQRYKQFPPEGITYYFDAFGSVPSCSSPASPNGTTAFSARDGGLYAAQGDYRSGGIAIAATVLD
jgi:hypothetical protein